jgi:hypothetical protein
MGDIGRFVAGSGALCGKRLGVSPFPYRRSERITPTVKQMEQEKIPLPRSRIPLSSGLRREGTDGLKTRMPRSTRFGLVIFAALLVVGGGYTAYWFLVARRIEAGVIDWAQSQRADKIDLSWQKLRVSGFPAAFRVDLGSAALRDGAITPSPELHVPVLSGTARPWDFADWRLAAPEGFTADFTATGAHAPAKLTAQTADGVV